MSKDTNDLEMIDRIIDKAADKMVLVYKELSTEERVGEKSRAALNYAVERLQTVNTLLDELGKDAGVNLKDEKKRLENIIFG